MDKINYNIYIDIYVEYNIKNNRIDEIYKCYNKTSSNYIKNRMLRALDEIIKKKNNKTKYYEKIYKIMIDSIEKSEDKIISFIIPEVKRVLRENFDEIYIHKNYIFRLVDLLNDYIKNDKVENIYKLAKSRIMERQMLFKILGNYYKQWQDNEFIKRLYDEFYCGEYMKTEAENIEVLGEYIWKSDYNECRYDTMYKIFYMRRNEMYGWENTHKDNIMKMIKKSEYRMNDFNFERLSDEDNRLINLYKDSECFIYEEYQNYIKEIGLGGCQIYSREEIERIEYDNNYEFEYYNSFDKNDSEYSDEYYDEYDEQ